MAGPSLVRHLEKSIEIGLGSGSPEEKIFKLGGCIGTGLHICEAIPCAVGFVAANPGDPVGALVGAVNVGYVGYDTDTTATMTGAIVGALYGADAFPAHYLPTLEQANGLPLATLAERIAATSQTRIKQEALI